MTAPPSSAVITTRCLPARPHRPAARPAAPPVASRHRQGGDDRGAATVFFSITVAGFLVLIGLIADGGTRVRGIERADTLAAGAARAAGQSIDLPAVMAGHPAVVSPGRARTAALAYLAASQATGTVTIGPGAATVTVAVTLQQPTLLLGLIGVPAFTAHGQATATLLRNQNGQATP
jgi:Flp pilus assembly protein TadG